MRPILKKLIPIVQATCIVRDIQEGRHDAGGTIEAMSRVINWRKFKKDLKACGALRGSIYDYIEWKYTNGVE